MHPLVYFSSQSENTHRFITRLGLPARRIPLDKQQRLRVDEPFILVVPSYGGGGAPALSGRRRLLRSRGVERLPV